MTVAELLDRMSSVEMAEWAAFFSLEAEDAAHSRKVAQSRSSRKRGR
jgi:hypothetical protein